MNYLNRLQQLISLKKTRRQSSTRPLSAISVPDLKSLDLNWKGANLFVQNASVVKDYGVFESPDIFFSEHKQTWNRIKDFAYVHFGRKMMNRNVDGIRISARSVERRENTCEFQYNLR